MTAYAFVDGSTASEIAQGGVGEPFANPFTGQSFPANWLLVATQAEREAEGIWPIEEPSAPVFPEKIVSTTLVVSAGPVVTRTPTLVDKTFAEQEADIHAEINAREASLLSGQFVGTNGAGGHADYPLSPTIRDAVSLYGTLAVNAVLGRRAIGVIDWNGQPAAGSTITVNGVTITFVTGTPSGDQVQIGAASSDTIAALAAFLNTHADIRVSQADYRKQGTDLLYITHKTFSTVGNAFTLAKGSSPDPNCDLETGANLIGGRDPAEPGDVTWNSVYTPHAGEWFGMRQVDNATSFLDAYQTIQLLRDMTFYVSHVTFYAADQRYAATAAAGAEDSAALLTIWGDVTTSANWDPGTPPTWP